MTPSYLLFALPGPGDALLEEATRQGCPPRALAVARPEDFAAVSLPRLPSPTCFDPDELKKLEIDLILVAGWEKRLPNQAWRTLPLGAWNVHPSLLPSYRGHNPYFWVLANRETKTGVSVHRLTEELDAGPLLLQRELEIAADETLGSLWRRLNRLGAEAGIAAIRALGAGPVHTIEQPRDHPLKAPRLASSDLLLHAEMSAAQALALIHAANPFYGAGLTLENEAVKIFEARLCAPALVDDPERLIVRFADGAIEVTVLEAEGWGYLSGRAWRARRRA